MTQKLFKTRSVILVFDLLRAVSRVEIVLKFTAVIDLVKRVRRFSTDFVSTIGFGGGDAVKTVLTWRSRLETLILALGLTNLDHRIRSRIIAILKLGIMAVGVLIEDIVGDLLRLVAGLDLLKNGVDDHFLLDKLRQLKRRHLQHLNALPQLRRKHHLLLQLMSES